MGRADRAPQDRLAPDRPRILLADDYPGLHAAFGRLLAPYFEVVGYVLDGRDVVDTAKRTRPDVTLLDLNLPGVDGLECCRRLREGVPATKVILLTAANSAAVRDRALALGASAFVAKQRAHDELVAAIGHVLRQDADACAGGPSSPARTGQQ